MNNENITKEMAYREDEKSRIAAHTEKLAKIKADLAYDEAHLWRKYKAELRPDFRPHVCEWSQVVRRAFATNVIKFILP